MFIRGTKGGLGGTSSHLLIYESIQKDLQSKEKQNEIKAFPFI
jgi:hypothetical protein